MTISQRAFKRLRKKRREQIKKLGEFNFQKSIKYGEDDLDKIIFKANLNGFIPIVKE